MLSTRGSRRPDGRSAGLVPHRMRSSAVLLLAICVVLGGCTLNRSVGTPSPPPAIAGGTLRVAIAAEAASLEPWNDDASLVATRQIFETLVEVDPATSRITPALASGWQMTNDGASWTFALRDGVRFHDGNALDAAAVVASFERGMTTRGSAYRALFADPAAILSVQAVDPRTVRFDLRAPFGPFLAHLAAPQTAIARGAAGTGPFAAPAGALALDGTLTLRRNDAYWGRDAAGKALADGPIPTPISADLAYPSVPTAAYPDPQRIAQSIAADLGKIGIVTRLRSVEPAALRDAGAALSLDTTVLGLDPDDVFWPLYGLDEPSGTSLIVGLVRKARAEADPTKRAELYKQVSKIARTDALRVPLLFADKSNATTARLVGYGGIEYFGTVWLRP